MAPNQNHHHRSSWVSFFFGKDFERCQIPIDAIPLSKYRLCERNRWERFIKLDAINGIEELTCQQKKKEKKVFASHSSPLKYSICQKNRTKSNQLKKNSFKKRHINCRLPVQGTPTTNNGNHWNWHFKIKLKLIKFNNKEKIALKDEWNRFCLN